MGTKEIYLNNIPISNVFFVESSENLIVCNSIKEEFFGVSTFKIGGKDILCEHLDNNVVKCSVRIGDKIYNDIPFNLIVDKKANTRVAINTKTLTNPKLFVEKKKEVVKPILEQKQQVNDDRVIKEVVQKLEQKDKAITQLEQEIRLLQRRNEEKQIIEEKNLNTFIQKNIEEGIESYKQKLFQDFFTVNEEQSNIKNALIKDTLSNLEETFNEKYIESVAEIRSASKDEVKKYTDNFLIEFQKILTEKQSLNISELKELIESTIKSDLFLVTEELQNKFNIRVDKNVDSLYKKLENYKQNLKDELTEILESKDELVKYTLEKDFDEKIASTKANLISDYITNIEKNNQELREDINQQFQLLQQKIDKKVLEDINFNSSELVAAAAKLLIEEDSRANNKLTKFKDQLLKDLQKAAEQYTTDANKRMMRYAEMMSGGGSTAMQFANGGTMKGDLNVEGVFLSGGVDLSTIFITSETDAQKLSWNETTSQLTISNGNTVSLSSLSASEYDKQVNTIVSTNSAKWDITYTYTNANSAKLDSVYTYTNTNSATWATEEFAIAMSIGLS